MRQFQPRGKTFCWSTSIGSDEDETLVFHGVSFSHSRKTLTIGITGHAGLLWTESKWGRSLVVGCALVGFSTRKILFKRCHRSCSECTSFEGLEQKQTDSLFKGFWKWDVFVFAPLCRGSVLDCVLTIMHLRAPVKRMTRRENCSFLQHSRWVSKSKSLRRKRGDWSVSKTNHTDTSGEKKYQTNYGNYSDHSALRKYSSVKSLLI